MTSDRRQSEVRSSSMVNVKTLTAFTEVRQLATEYES
jgi:hypothetical protein